MVYALESMPQLGSPCWGDMYFCVDPFAFHIKSEVFSGLQCTSAMLALITNDFFEILGLGRHVNVVIQDDRTRTISYCFYCMFRR